MVDVNEELKFFGRVVGSQGGCERRSEFIVNIQKMGGGVGLVRMDVNGENGRIEVFVKMQKQNQGGGGGGGSG